jgi:hypothetical protein
MRVIVRNRKQPVSLTEPLRDKHTKALVMYLGRLPCGRLAFGRQSPAGSWGTTSCDASRLDDLFENDDQNF